MLAELRSSNQLLFQQLPLLEIDDLKLIQSGAIIRYLARKFDLYGKNDLEAVQCDMIADGIIDYLGKFVRYSFNSNKESYLSNDVVPSVARYLKPLEAMIDRNRGDSPCQFLLGDHISYPDLLLVELLEYVNELIPDQLEGYPLLGVYYGMMCSRPRIKDFRESKRHYPLAGDDYVAHVRSII